MTSLIKIREIPGGIHPPEHKAQSLRLPLGSVPLPPQLVVPVSQHIGEPATPVVNVGERVLTGQLIAAANGVFSANIHAPSSGGGIHVVNMNDAYWSKRFNGARRIEATDPQAADKPATP